MYCHSGKIGNVFKHLPLCEILKQEKPIRYRETNSAGAEYTLDKTLDTEYGIYFLLESKHKMFEESDYIKILKANGLDFNRFLGSPAFAMNILKESTEYHFHDIDEEALNDIRNYELVNKLNLKVNTYLGDSIEDFLNEDYFLDDNDFIFIDPYEIFDTNSCGHSFFDVFEKAIVFKSKICMWYGYENLKGKQRINNHFKEISDRHKAEIVRFEIWQSCMENEKCGIKMNGIPGCGVACVNLSNESFQIFRKYMQLLNILYENATYNGTLAPLLAEKIKT